MGSVVSNTVFKDRHSIPIRRARTYHNEHYNGSYRPSTSKSLPIKQVQNEFDKAISFKTDYKPETLISKLGGAFVVIKNEVRAFIEDNNSKVYKHLENIHQTTIRIYKEVLTISAETCLKRANGYERRSKTITAMPFGRFIGLHLVWMPKYAKVGDKRVTKAAIANILDIIALTFPVTRFILLIVGVASYYGATQKVKDINRYGPTRAQTG